MELFKTTSERPFRFQVQMLLETIRYVNKSNDYFCCHYNAMVFEQNCQNKAMRKIFNWFYNRKIKKLPEPSHGCNMPLTIEELKELREEFELEF